MATKKQVVRKPISKLIVNNSDIPPVNRLVVGTPTTGLVRMEWALARYGQIIPCNWSASQSIQYINTYSPLGFMVCDAQNIIVQNAIAGDYEWLILIEDDNIIPPDLFIKFNEYMRKGDIPVVSGLYYTKSDPAEPILYRGRGTSFYDDWKLGDKVWVDGLPTGCLLLDMKLVRKVWENSPEYAVGGQIVRRVFEQPEKMWKDEESGAIHTASGTSDLEFCHRVIKEGYLKDFPAVANKKYPFLVDTSIFVKHIDRVSGKIYPEGELSKGTL